nr:hypothetical protein HmN_000533100 [Hymenolepis microstoma]
MHSKKFNIDLRCLNFKDQNISNFEISQTLPSSSIIAQSMDADLNQTNENSDVSSQIEPTNESCVNDCAVSDINTISEKPFKCDQCEKAYTQAHSLKKHKEKRHVRSIGSPEQGNWTEKRDSMESTTAFETLLIE